jgi:hypothetical protein
VEFREPKNSVILARMAIVDDYAAIAAELRRLRAERDAEPAAPTDQPNVGPLQGSWHPMRATRTGEALYRRLISQRRKANSACRTGLSAGASDLELASTQAFTDSGTSPSMMTTGGQDARVLRT